MPLTEARELGVHQFTTRATAGARRAHAVDMERAFQQVVGRTRRHGAAFQLGVGRSVRRGGGARERASVRGAASLLASALNTPASHRARPETRGARPTAPPV